ncbi:hypothetical protein QBC44DRAFT_361456 [Cladorrhinum sp. PSN332]|nr:hypothetical protein QBC44DRAFT_361456 [Cladorrhinum sp. PSN332]
MNPDQENIVDEIVVRPIQDIDDFYRTQFEERYRLTPGSYPAGLASIYRLFAYGDLDTAIAMADILGRCCFLTSPFPAILVCGSAFGVFSPELADQLQTLIRYRLIECNTDLSRYHPRSSTNRYDVLFRMQSNVQALALRVLARECPDDLGAAFHRLVTELVTWYPKPPKIPSEQEDGISHAHRVVLGRQISSLLAVFERHFDTSLARQAQTLYYPVDARKMLIDVGVRFAWWLVGRREWNAARTFGWNLFRIIIETPGCPVYRDAGRAPMRSCMIMMAYAMIKRNRGDFGEIQFPERVKGMIRSGALTAEEVTESQDGLAWLERAVKYWMPHNSI